MELDRFTVLELIAQDEDRDMYAGRDVSNSADVLVHALKPPLARLAASIAPRPGVLYMGERDGQLYLVTESRPEYRNIRKWIEDQLRSPDAPNEPADSLSRAGLWKVPSVISPPQGKEETEPGEFTRLFQAPGAPASPQTPSRPSAEPGEFTRMFSAAGDKPAEPVPDPVLPPLSSKDSSDGPGEFTRMFQAADTPAPSDAGNFTSLFGSVSTENASRPWTAENETTPARKTNDGPGEFTRMFTSVPPEPPKEDLILPPPAESPPAPKANQEATGIFTAPTAPPPSAPAAPAVPAGPSEFTRVIAVPPKLEALPKPVVETPPTPPAAAPQAPVLQAPVPQAPPKPNTPSYLPLILIMNGLFLAAIALILYFIFRR